MSAPPTKNAPSPATALAGADARAGKLRPQIVSERSPRERSITSGSHVLTRPWFRWMSGAFAAILSFTVVLWLTSPVTAPPGVAILENANVSDATSLMAAVQTAGLRGTPDVKGEIEAIRRIDSERVTIKGWAIDKTESSSLLTIITFAGGPRVSTTMTNGARNDVAQMFGLSGAAARNVSFETTFRCAPGEKIVVVAVTSGHAYSQFRSLACP
jgi:hypothetical protein